MANLKISQLTDGSPAQSTDQIPVNRAGTNFRVDAGSLQLIQTATVTLTDAQIKTLPTTPIRLVTDPGAGKLLVLISAVAVAKSGSPFTPYTNLDVTSYRAIIVYGADANESASNPGTFYWRGLLGGSETAVLFNPFILSESIGPTTNTSPGIDQTNITPDKGFWLWVDNGVSGNFTGGNVGNTLKVTVYYVVVDL